MNNTLPRQIVVMTGATAGIGAEAVKHFVAQSDTLVLVGARGSGRTVPGTEVLPLDLTSLASVRAFAEAVTERLAGRPIDRLVLNAGLQFAHADQRSSDGFEATFAVNHLAHYLLARVLLPLIAEGGHLLITTSDTHDPALMPLAPKTLDPQGLAHARDTSIGGGMRAYAASKLCNLLTARSFVALDQVKAKNIQVIAYNPGLTGGTSLVRYGSAPMQAIFRMLTSGPFGRLLFDLLGRFNPAYTLATPERAGEALAQLALGQVTPPAGRVYASLVKGMITYPDPAPLAQNDSARDQLWRESATMVGL